MALCRRLKPPFKVRVSMKITSSMHCPIVLCAHAISQTEFERIETWRPPEMAAKLTHQMVERPTPTELKGNLSLEWRFEGVRCRPAFSAVRARRFGRVQQGLRALSLGRFINWTALILGYLRAIVAVSCKGTSRSPGSCVTSCLVVGQQWPTLHWRWSQRVHRPLQLRLW